MSIAPGEGERRAQRGYVGQYDLGAHLLYECLASGTLMWVGLADRTAGRFDDIVLGLPDKTVAYQVKTSRDPEAFSLRTLLFGSESLLETMLDSRARLINQEPLRVVEIVYACDDYPRTNDNLVDDEPGFDSAEFLRFHVNHGRTYSLEDWQTSSYGTFVDSVQKASGLNGNDFETFWQNTRFKTGSAAHKLRNAMSAKDKRRIADLAALLPRLVSDSADKDRWSQQELLGRLGWPDPFALRHLHTFPVDALYESNAKTQSDLSTALTTLLSGYVALLGPPGSGKSTLLAAGVLPTPKAFVLRYLAFIPNESQGLGRAEAVSFLHDIVKQLKRTGLGNHLVPGSEIDELRGQLSELLIEAGQRFADRGVRTVIVVDGLDHVSREEKPDRSFLKEFPLPIAVPPGVLFVLGSQKLELPDNSTSVRDQAATGGRLIKIAPLTRDAVNRLAEVAEIPADVDREKLYSKTEGHPLSTRYVLDGLKRAADDRERKAWLDSGPDYGGDVDVFYRRALHDIEGNESAQAGLAYLALAEGSIGLPSLDHAIGRSAVDGLMRAAGYLLKVDRNRSASIFHNSFRLFLRAELFIRHGARDEDRIRTLYGELASMAKIATEDDPQHWMELRYRARAADFQTVAALATAAAFREQFQLGRSSQEIRSDLSLCFRAVAELRNTRMLLEVIFASHELNMRVQNLGDEVFDALIALGDLEYAKRMLLGADAQLSEDKGFELVHAFLQDRDADEARDTFEFLEPLEELLGTKTVGANRPSDRILESWAEVALAFREPARFLASLARLQPADGWGPEPVDLAPFRAKLKLLAARGQLDRHSEMDTAELALELEIEEEHLGLLQFLAVRSAFDSGNDVLAEQRLQEAYRNPEVLAPVNLRQLADLAWSLSRPDIAQVLTERVGETPTFAVESSSLDPKTRNRIAHQIILHASLRSRLELPPEVGETPKSRIFRLLQIRLEALGSSHGRALSGLAQEPEQTYDFKSLLDFLERAKGDEHIDFDRSALNGLIGTILSAMIELADLVGPDTLRLLTDAIDSRLQNSDSPLGFPASRRAYVQAIYRVDGNSEHANERLAYKLGRERSPIEEFREAAETSIVFAAIGSHAMGAEVLRSAHAQGIGCSRAAKKDPQYILWEALLERAGRSDPAGREARVRFMTRLLRGVADTEGDDLAQRVSEALLREAGCLDTKIAGAVIDICEISYLTSWAEVVENIASAVSSEDSSFAELSAALIACLAMPFAELNFETTISHLVELAPTEQVQKIVDRISLAVAVESSVGGRNGKLEHLYRSAVQRGLAMPVPETAPAAAAAPRSSRNTGSSDDPFASAQTLGEIKQILASHDGRAKAHSATYAVERVGPSSDYEELRQFLKDEPGVSPRESLLELLAGRAHSVGKMQDFQEFLGKLQLLTEDRGSWGGAWSGDAKQRIYRLRRDTGDGAAETEAFVRFANDMAARRESVELVLPELCSLLDIFSPKLEWHDAWECLREHLSQYREYKHTPEIADRTDLGSGRCDLIADLLYRAYETTSLPLIQMARTATIECALCQHGPEVLAILVARLWRKASFFQSEAAQILWETRNLPGLRELVEVYLPKMQAETDFEVRSAGIRIATEWSHPLSRETVPLPAVYSLVLPSRRKEETFEPPIGVTESSSGVYTDNFRDWTWSLERPLKLVSDASGIDVGTIRYRVGVVMSNNMPNSPFDPPANAAQMTKLKRLSLHASYWKLMTGAAYRAMREVVGELMAAQAIDPDALHLLQSLVGVCSPRIPSVSPSARPAGFKFTEMPEPFAKTEADGGWVDRVNEDQVRPTMPGWFVLAACSVQQRGFREEQWIAEQWWGPGEPVAQTSFDHVLHSLPLTVINDGLTLQQGSVKSVVLRPMAALSSFQESPLLFSPVVAKRLGLAADPADAFRYRDRQGNFLIRTIQWRDGGIHAKESDTTHHGYGTAVLVASTLKASLLPILPAAFTLTSWRRYQNHSNKVQSRSASDQFAKTEL